MSFQANFLSYSGGTGSSALLWMVLKNKIEKPKNFYVLNANPGMEDHRTIQYVEKMRQECANHNIEFVTVPGPNLYNDIINLKNTNNTRLDNPPYWTINSKTGKRGRLMQKCTEAYKIRPMAKEIRRILLRDFNISLENKRLPNNCVVQWIGFTYDEWHRASESNQKFRSVRYPLIEAKITKDEALSWMNSENIEIPPRSVCVACFANRIDFFKEMYQNRPDDFEKACKVDDSIRNLSQVMINDKCFVSKSCVPLRDLPKIDFKVEDYEEDLGCHNGYCFV